MGPNVNNGAEVACQSNKGGVITTGGGFSTYYPMPEWQMDAVNGYLNTHTPSPGFNPMGRAYPDISLMTVDYPVIVNGKVVPLYGTSASSPVFAAMISLINSKRIAHGLPSVGWINPILYANRNTINPATGHSYYHDITVGDNKCCSSNIAAGATCCDAGFKAGTGWDPVTGFGSIKFDALSAMFGITTNHIPSPTAAPTYAAMTPTPEPTFAPTEQESITSYAVNVIYNTPDCSGTPLLMQGSSINVCYQSVNLTGYEASYSYEVYTENLFIFSYKNIYSTHDCSGDPIKEVFLNLATSGCSPFGGQSIAAVMLTDSTPWLTDTIFQGGVMTITYGQESDCLSPYGVSAVDFVWIPTNTCLNNTYY